MNLINFHKFDKNKRFIAENMCHTVGQGLVNSYRILLFGNGHNEYTIELLDETTNSKHILYLHENNLYEWRIKVKSEEQNPYDSVEIDAIGILDNLGYFRVDTHYLDFDHILVNNREFKVEDIIITNKHEHIKLITGITNDYIFVDNRDEKYKHHPYESNTKSNYSLDSRNKLDFRSFVNTYDQSRTYYFVTVIEVFPFKIKTLEAKENECTIVCLISWRSKEYETVVQLSDYLADDEDDDDYTIAIKFKISIELFNVTNEVDDYCYIEQR